MGTLSHYSIGIRGRQTWVLILTLPSALSTTDLSVTTECVSPSPFTPETWLPTIRTAFPSPFAVRYSHLTPFWPVRYKCCRETSGKPPKMQLACAFALSLLSPSSTLPSGCGDLASGGHHEPRLGLHPGTVTHRRSKDLVPPILQQYLCTGPGLLLLYFFFSFGFSVV